MAEPSALLPRTTENGHEGGPTRHWVAAYTRSQHEGLVAAQLRRKSVEHLLPTYERLSRWSDRIRRTEAPLFPGYVFVRVCDAERLIVLRTAGVVGIVSVAGKPALLRDEDVEMLRTCMARRGEIEPYPYLSVGQRVRVKHGPFSGWEGILLQKKNSARLIISFAQMMRSIAIDFHGADVHPLG